MDFTMRWIQPIFPSKRCILHTFIAGVLFISGSINVDASPLSPGLLSEVVIQASGDRTSVAQQTNYLLKLSKKEIRTGNVEKGKALLQKILILDPQHREAQQELTKLMGTGATLQPNSNMIAASNSNAMPSLESLSSAELVDVAKAMMRDGDYIAAQSTLERALEKSKDVKERKQISTFLSAIGKEKSRFEQAHQAQIEYNLDELERQLQKSVIYLENGQYDKAEIELQRAKLISPEDKRVEALFKRLLKERSFAKDQSMAQETEAQLVQAAGQIEAADSIFNDGVTLYKEGQIIKAVQKWNDALKVYPDHQPSKTYLTNTRTEYEQVVKANLASEQLAAEEAKFEKMLDSEILQYSTQGDRVDIKNVVSFLSNLSGLNVMMAENLEGEVAFEVKNTTVRGILNLLQKQYGFVWEREGNTIFVNRGFKSQVFPLTDAQYATFELILSDPTVLDDSSKNLLSILYGPQNEFDVPGKELFLSENTRSLVVTDTTENLQKVSAFLQDMPEITGLKKPVNISVYKLNADIAKEIYELVKIILFQDLGAYDVKDNRRQLFLEPNSNNLIVIDYPENIEKVETLLSNQQVTSKLEEGELNAKNFTIVDMDDVEDTPEAFARREELVQAIFEVIEQMLWGKMGREEARLQGKMIVPNPARGTIDIVDTRQNIRRVEEYLNSIRGDATQDVLIESYPIKSVDVFTIADALAYLFFDSQQTVRASFLSQNLFTSLGTSEQGDVGNDLSNIAEESSRNKFNLAGGGGGGTDLLQYFTVRFYPDINTNSIVVFTTDQEVLDIVTRIINTFDKPQRMIELESRIVSVNLSDLRTINFDYLLTNPLVDPISMNPEQQVQSISMNQLDNNGLNLSIQTMGTSRLEFLMNLLEDTTSLNVLAAPKVISVVNPIEPPTIFVGQQIPYTDDISIDDGGDDDPTNNRLVYQFQRAFAGISLAFIPFILNDDHVYIELAPQVIEAGERLQLTPTGGDVSAMTQIPNIGPLLMNQKYIRTSVRLKNGQTIVLGGLIDEKETESQKRVPVLHKIPFLGNLFKDRRIEKTKNSTLIFLTTKIIEPEY
jgi:type II secretory pathway component GspD/PulD (secretin)